MRHLQALDAKIRTLYVYFLLTYYMKLYTIVSFLLLFLSINGQAQPPAEVINEIVNTINDIREEGWNALESNRSPPIST